MKMKYAFLVQTSLIALLLAACAAPTPVPTATPTAPAPSVRYYFVTNQLLIPTTKEQADSFALNIDGDPQNHHDNLFGGLLTLLVSAAPNLGVQSTVDQAINAGQIVTLHTFEASDPLNSANAAWSVFLGQTSQSAPRFDGTDAFTIDSSVPINTVIHGPIVNGHFSGGPGEVRAQLVVLGTTIDVGLIGVRIEADVTDKGCKNGRLGGGITVSEFNGKILPAIAAGLNQLSAADKSAAGALISTLDGNNDGTISSDELAENVLVKLATTPDLDLLDASGKFNPRQDGVKDSMSVGLGFTCAPAVFTAPAE